MKKKYISKLKASPILLVLLVASVLVSATILGFFFKSTTSVSTDDLFLIDDTPPSELELSRTITDTVGGNVHTYTRWLNASENIQNNVTLNFEWTGDNATVGITPELLYNGNPITELVIETDTDYLITERFTIDTMVNGTDSFTCILTVDAV